MTWVGQAATVKWQSTNLWTWAVWARVGDDGARDEGWKETGRRKKRCENDRDRNKGVAPPPPRKVVVRRYAYHHRGSASSRIICPRQDRSRWSSRLTVSPFRHQRRRIVCKPGVKQITSALRRHGCLPSAEGDYFAIQVREHHWLKSKRRRKTADSS